MNKARNDKAGIDHHNMLVNMLTSLEVTLAAVGRPCTLTLHDRFSDQQNDRSYVNISFDNGRFTQVNITADSGLAAIVDIIRKGFM